jgi:OOP family OmpA-OmpF porin
MPSERWSEAVAMAIGAVADLGGGTVTLTDADVSLVAPAGTSEELFERVAGELENALPPLFALDAVLDEEPDAGAVESIPEFSATLSADGQVQLRGRVADTLMNTTAETYAKAQFDGAEVSMGTRVTEGLPPGWSVRVLAGIAALGELESGSVVVRPDRVRVSGLTGNPDARTEIARLLVDKLGQDAEFAVDVTYEERLDPIAALPTPEECLEQIGVVTENRKITFDPGSADIAGPAQIVMDDIAEILRRCPDLRVEVAGFTDSQGREEMNLRLSQDRADSVLRGLRERRVPVGSFNAVGYGEENPIADNDTEEGREANRRIEFRLVGDEVTEASDEAGQEPAEGETPEAGGEDGDDEQD